MYMNVTTEERGLLTLYRQLDKQTREDILRGMTGSIAMARAADIRAAKAAQVKPGTTKATD